MISVILYGRNDSYGYNVHKRAAISLNCIAEVLTHPDDEILFVDCNTPDDLPTFPEAIKDTLTQRTKRLLRIFRLRPALYATVKGDSHLNALEPISRNIAIRRSNPANPWILSTNTDMVFVPRQTGQSLSDIAAAAQGDFYELPRFEVPEVLWESVDRLDPEDTIARFRHWGTRLHLNEVVHGQPHILYDAPGDFQLVRRRHLFDIHGYNEAMRRGWHVDSNLCKRLTLHVGNPDSLLAALFGYHCDHTRVATPMHGAGKKENCMIEFIKTVDVPTLVEQADTWGLPDQSIEELVLTDVSCRQYETVLESLLPGATAEYLINDYTEKSYNTDLRYDVRHAFPYIADNLVTVSPRAAIAYFGANHQLLDLLAAFREGCAHDQGLWYHPVLLSLAAPESVLPHRAFLEPQPEQALIQSADILFFDFGLQAFPGVLSEKGFPIPRSTKETSFYCLKLFKVFVAAVRDEARRLAQGDLPRKWIITGVTNTLFEPIIGKAIGLHMVPFSCHFKHGYLLGKPDLEALDAAVDCFARQGFYFENIILVRCRQLSEDFGVSFTDADYECVDNRLVSLQKLAMVAKEDVGGYARKALDLGLSRLDLALMRLHAQFSLSQGMLDACAIQLELHDLWKKILDGEIIAQPSPTDAPATNKVAPPS